MHLGRSALNHGRSAAAKRIDDQDRAGGRTWGYGVGPTDLIQIVPASHLPQIASYQYLTPMPPPLNRTLLVGGNDATVS
jgi:hypothetical protein